MIRQMCANRNDMCETAFANSEEGSSSAYLLSYSLQKPQEVHVIELRRVVRSISEYLGLTAAERRLTDGHRSHLFKVSGIYATHEDWLVCGSFGRTFWCSQICSSTIDGFVVGDAPSQYLRHLVNSFASPDIGAPKQRAGKTRVVSDAELSCCILVAKIHHPGNRP